MDIVFKTEITMMLACLAWAILLLVTALLDEARTPQAETPAPVVVRQKSRVFRRIHLERIA